MEAVLAHLLDLNCHTFATVSKKDYRLSYWSQYVQKTIVIAYKSFHSYRNVEIIFLLVFQFLIRSATRFFQQALGCFNWISQLT